MKPINIFMTGEWKDLIMLTFEVDKSILKPYLPKDTEIDLYKGKALLSMVAFTFSKVNFFNFAIPFHQLFGQINFRFYAKSKINGSKGVVFIKEFAPKPLIAFIANKFYNEPYFFKPIIFKKKVTQNRIDLKYQYKNASVEVSSSLQTTKPSQNTLEHFIVDRYIAFVKSKKHQTFRYNIYHKPWKIHQLKKTYLNKELLKLLPSHFVNLKLRSTLLVDGSSVKVEKGIMQ
ncbi:DUF2071 domain-containing protein [Tamlana sp. 2201CG12-4]|uniref:DUF2071 domain-containing protein n=1 Tax=Tamlana sp. 2201CG12-4 TaxID=3112582 RepID=UPI002DB75C7D|nr:DUF2071 domain-containing protein [Tamlana sp. 2201CG12-4]MEC3906879.1 DUF2071 domain-containing protein [Tamlana sp. 2201CG12-4]